MTITAERKAELITTHARKDGDTEILEVGTSYYVSLFHSRGREEYKTVDIRHILITPETGTKAQGDEGYEDEQTQLKAAARTKAEELAQAISREHASAHAQMNTARRACIQQHRPEAAIAR